MSNHFIKAISVGATLVLAAGGAWAQTSNAVNPPATTIGVTPQDAKEATQKAVPRADTGTLVRTKPSAAERAGDMAKDAKKATKPAKSSTANANTAQPKAGTSGTTSANTTGAANTSMTPGAATNITSPKPAASAPVKQP